MTDLSPGQEVTVSPHSTAATVVYTRYDTARVRFTDSGRERTVALSRVTPKRESKALSVAELDQAPLVSIADIVARSTSTLRPVHKPITLTSPAYLAYVRKHPCCLCGATPSEAHHWSHHGGVMGSKVDDYRTVPLCQEHHRYWHDHGTLPEMDRVGSEGLFLRTQGELLLDWAWLEGAAVVVDGLIRAIGGADV